MGPLNTTPVDDSGVNTKIPPMPQHPRFLMTDGRPQFLCLTYDRDNYEYRDIERLEEIEIEDCCCVAIVAWEDVMRGQQTQGRQQTIKQRECNRNVDQWRAYKEKRNGK